MKSNIITVFFDRHRLQSVRDVMVIIVSILEMAGMTV